MPLRSNISSNCAFTASAARRAPAVPSSGEASSLMLSDVQEATVKSVTRLRKLNTGVGSPLDSTPSHCRPTKKFSFTRTLSSSWMEAL